MRQLTYWEISSFCEEVAWLVHSGVSVAGALNLLGEDEKDKTWKECLDRMADRLDEGQPFSEAMGEEHIFPTYVQGIIRVGEYTGRLEESLKALASYYAERERMSRRIKDSLLYPSILLLLMVVVMLVLLTQVLPIFESVFASLGGKMEGLAGGLLTLGLWLDKAMPVLCVLLAFAVVAVLIFVFNMQARDALFKLIRRMAGDRGIMRQMNDASFAQAVSMGLSSGLVMEETMELAAQVLADVPAAKERCLLCKEKLTEGIPLVDALKEADVFPAAACRLLSLGMQSGNGDVIMAEIAARLSEEADVALTNRVAKIEPTLVLVTSILVGAILLSVMLPLMNIMEAIG